MHFFNILFEDFKNYFFLNYNNLTVQLIHFKKAALDKITSFYEHLSLANTYGIATHDKENLSVHIKFAFDKINITNRDVFAISNNKFRDCLRLYIWLSLLLLFI